MYSLELFIFHNRNVHILIEYLPPHSFYQVWYITRTKSSDDNIERELLLGHSYNICMAKYY